MAFTFNDVQNITVSKASKKVAASSAFNTVVDSTKSAGSKAVGAVKGVAPVTNRRFEDMVSQLNEKHNNHELEIFKNKVRTHMIAGAVGVNLPSDEELEAMYKEFKEDEAKQAQLEKEAQEAAKKEEAEKEENKAGHSILDALLDPKVISAFKSALFPAKEEPKEELIKNDEELEEYMTEETPKEEEIQWKKCKSCDKMIAKQYIPDTCRACSTKPEEKEEEPVQEEAPAKNPDEWKQCTSCNKDISVMYKHDECPHCRRTKKAAEAQNDGGSKPRPRLRFDQSTQA